MSKGLWLPVWAGLLAGSLHAGPMTIGFQTTNLGSGNFQYTYTITGFAPIGANQAIDITFSHLTYGVLSNGVATGFNDFVLKQPGGGLDGLWSALTTTGVASTNGPFSVQFTLLGGQSAGPQAWALDQYDNTDTTITNVLATGTTVSSVPEPASLTLCGLGLLLAGVGFTRRRR